MSVAERTHRAGFSLRLEQGRGRLVLSDRRVADLWTVDKVRIALREVPARLDLSAGVDRFRHQRGVLDQLTVHVEDHDLGRYLRGACVGGLLTDLEVHAVDGDLVVVGAIQGPQPAPFLVRARLAPASVASDRAVLVSVYETRIFTPARLSAPELAQAVLVHLGLEKALVGPTVAVLDPIDRILFEICAELAWKVPDRRQLRLVDVRSEAGRLVLTAGARQPHRLGPRGLAVDVDDGGPRARRFLADYEAKTLFQAVESLISEGRIERAIRAYERQLDVHPEHPFLTARLMQLTAARAESGADAAAHARARLARAHDDPDARCALAVVQAHRGEAAAAAETLRQLAETAESQGDVVEAAQARCGIAAVLTQTDPRAAIAALEMALATRRRLPGALRALADLYASVGDWAAALHTRERLLTGESDPQTRRSLLLALGRMALEDADAIEAAVGYFEQALELARDDVDALVGLSAAHERAGRILPAVRALDRATQRLQQQGEAQRAADQMVALGHLWRRLPDDGAATAALRYRQALFLVPGHQGAILGLAETALLSGDASRARAHLEEALRVDGTSPEHRAIIQLRLGDLLAGPLDAPARAVVAYQKALQGAPEQVNAAVEALQALFARLARWGDLVRLLELAIERATDDARRGTRLTELATLLVTHLGDHDRARGLLEEASRLRPRDPAVLQALVGAWRAAGSAEGLADALQRLAACTDDPGQLAALHAERGTLLRQSLNAAEAAATSYGLALACDPDHAEALAGLADVYREGGRGAELAGLLERLVSNTPAGFDRGLYLLELARLEHEVLHRPDAALVHYQAASVDLPDETEPLRRAGSLLMSAGRPTEAAERFERLFGRYEAEGYDEPAGPFLLAWAEALQAANVPAKALELAVRAVAFDPELAAAYELARDLHLKQGDVEAIVAFFEGSLANAKTPAVRALLARQAGRLAWRELRRAGQAATLLDAALEAEPDDATTRVRLEVATALADWPRVERLLRNQLDGAPSRARPALLTRLARLAFGTLDRPAEGFELIEAAIAERPDYAPALTVLGERATEAGDWPRARRAYGRLVESTAARHEDRIALARAELEDGAGDRALGRLLAVATDAQALPGFAQLVADAALAVGDVAQLEAHLDARLPSAPLAWRARAALVLAGRPSALRLGVVEPPPTAPPQASAIQVVGDGPVPAGAEPDRVESLPPPVSFAALPVADGRRPPTTLPPSVHPPRPAESVDELPLITSSVDAPSLESMNELPSLDGTPQIQADDPQALEAETERLERAAAEAAPEAAASAWLTLAEHRRDTLRDPEGAMPEFEAALASAEPGDMVWTESIEALEDMHAIHQNWDGLLRLYDRRIVDGVGDAAEIELHKASVLRTAGRPEAALAAAEAARGLGERAIELLVVLLQEAGRVSDAADALLGDVGQLSPHEAAMRRWRAADLLAEADASRAVGLYAAANRQIDEPELVEDWLALAERCDEPASRTQALEARARTQQGDGAMAMRRSSTYMAAAEIAVERLNDDAWARTLLDAALQAWPGNVEAVVMLPRVLEALGDEPALIAALAGQIEVCLPGPERGAIALKLGRLYDSSRGDHGAARPFLEMAHADLQGCPELSEVQALLTSTEARPEATLAEAPARPLNELAQGLRTPARWPVLLTELEDRLAANAEDVDAWALLVRLHRARGDAAAEAVARVHQVEQTASSAKRAELFWAWASLQADVLGAPDAAREGLRMALAESEVEPTTVARVIRALARLEAAIEPGTLSPHLPALDQLEQPGLAAALRAVVLGDDETAAEYMDTALGAEPPLAFARLVAARRVLAHDEARAQMLYGRALELHASGEAALEPQEVEEAFAAVVRGLDEPVSVVLRLLDRQPALLPALRWLNARWADSHRALELLVRLEAGQQAAPEDAQIEAWLEASSI
jgi:tetratricopeptide (TPR) repeat protein